jgi:hypothetical protein
MAARRGAPRVGGVGAILDRGSRSSVGDARPPASPASPGVPRSSSGGERFARCGTAVAGWEINRFGGRPARCSACLPDPWASMSGRVQGDDPVVAVRWRVGATGWLRRHPAGTGSSGTGVPPRRGRLPAQPRCSVVPPTQPRSPRKASTRTRGTTRDAETGGEGIRVWGAGNGALKPTVPDRVDTTGPGSRIRATAGPRSAERGTAGSSWSRYAPPQDAAQSLAPRPGAAGQPTPRPHSRHAPARSRSPAVVPALWATAPGAADHGSVRGSW